MHISLPGRIGIYLVVIGLALDLIALHYFGDLFGGFSILLFPAALLMFLAWAIGEFNEKTDSLRRKRAMVLAIDPNSIPAAHGSHRRPHLRTLISAMPSFGLLLVLVLSLALCSIAIVQSIFSPVPARGFWVSIPRQYPGATAQVSSEGKIVLQIDAQNRWYLNSREISPAELPSALQKALAQRPDWVVYLDASPEIDYKHAVSAISIIRDAHAQIVLITPRMKGTAR